MGCVHCETTGKCKQSIMKFDKHAYEVWYECELCGSTEHIKYGGFFKYPGLYVRRKAENKALYCQSCNGKGY